MAEHEHSKRGAKYLRGRGPLELALECRVGSRSLATRIEQRIKRLPKQEKADLDALNARIRKMLGDITDAAH